jgi:hypothetical protein
MMGARCRKAGRGGGGMPSIVSGGGPMSEHSTHDVLKYINRSTPLAMLLSCKEIKATKLHNCDLIGSEPFTQDPLGEFYFSCPKKISKRRTIPYFSLHS